MTPDPRLVPRLLRSADARTLTAHRAEWGRRPRGTRRLVVELERARLGGRGGAGFATAKKWQAAWQNRAVAVIANGTEGEPASAKDKTLLTHSPHLVLDGLAIAAETVGATEAIVCVDGAERSVVRAVSRAITERAPRDPLPISLAETPSGYLTGEESALVNWLNGKDAKPLFAPRPFERGLHGRPTLVNNVETLANAALIARFGSEWFSAVGTSASPGTALVTISGDVARGAVFEATFGSPLVSIIRRAAPTSRPAAVLIGGYAGTWLSGRDLEDAVLDADHLRALGATLGCGSLVVVGEQSCGLTTMAAVAGWMAEQSAGQCGPCLHGLAAVAQAADELAAPGAPERWEGLLARWLPMVEGRGACKHPDGTARMVRSGLAAFSSEIELHRRQGHCGRPLTPVPVPRYETLRR